MSIQKLHYENMGGMLIRREGLLNWRCPLCKAEGQSREVMRVCPKCGSKEAALSCAQAQPAQSIHPAALSPVINWLRNGCDPAKAADELELIVAKPAPIIPEGWKLVPIEPTEKMINEGTCAATLPGPHYIDSACAKQCWTNMLAAATE